MRRRTAPLLICLPAVFTLALAPLSSDGKVGDTLSLTGLNDTQLDVTVIKVVEPAGVEPSFFKIRPENHLVAVQLRLKNTGTGVYDDAPWIGASVVDASNQRFNTSMLTPTTAGVELPGSITLRPGATALGYLCFEVPDNSRVVTVQYSMNSGFSDDVGEWAVSYTA
ncbi:DUF4352 domain-containing protein [Streptomyces niveiscabiei]|uniref:DUF4352 domain-containing protein n=1 Tax=Streptomyces niveiscabiei TaxID=164115 RepID=UPI0029BB484B|nr:DUF4352 domain-containing protein [Streptomyces niveiscabiei]MDX3380150.1 DUF4352 domain-containing protein [Streptomyces niveiscabiei]